MSTVSDPAIFFSIYLEKYPPGPAADERIQVLRQVDAFVAKHNLQPHVPERPYRRAADIDFLRLAETPPNFQILLQFHSEFPKAPTGTYYECLGYVYHDALIFQITISKFADWSDSLLAGWDELTGDLHSAISGAALTPAQDSTFGISVLYWALAESHSDRAYTQQIHTIAEEQDLRQTTTDLGAPLWRCERPLFRECSAIPHDLWMLITPRSSETQVNQRFSQPRFNGPSDFAIVALAGHKIAYERAEYQREREGMGRIWDDLDGRICEILDLQRHLGPQLDELRSDHAIQFQRRLAEASAVLADYGQSVGKLKELRRTVVINARAFLIHCVALVSMGGANEVDSSIDQESAAARFLAKSHRDEIFARQLSGFQGLCRQLDSDIDYASSMSERHASSLRSASDQLRIAGERELGEMAHHLSVDSAAVVASVVAVLAVELILKSSKIDTDTIGIGRWSLALALIVGSFGLTQMLSSGCRGKHLERWSAAIAIGFFGVFLANRYLTPGHFNFPHWGEIVAFLFHHWHEIVAFLAGMLLGWFGHRRIKEYRAGSAREHVG